MEKIDKLTSDIAIKIKVLFRNNKRLDKPFLVPVMQRPLLHMPDLQFQPKLQASPVSPTPCYGYIVMINIPILGLFT